MSGQRSASESSKVSGGVLASLGGLAVLLIFVLQNRNSVTFDFLWLRFSWPMWLYTIVVAAVGALIWLGLGVLRRQRRRRSRRAAG